MMRVRLNKSIVEKAELRPKRYTIWDTEIVGFGLKVQPTGTKTYCVFYRAANGQQRRPAIGLHGKLTTEEARQIARKWVASALLGNDVSATRQEARSSAVVSELAKRYLNEYALPHKKPSSFKSDKANLENYVLPLIGTLKIDKVIRADIEYVKTSIREGKTARRLQAKRRGRRIVRGGPGVANRVVALLSKMFTCAVDWGLRTDNPALRIRKYPEYRKDRFLDMPEIRRLLHALTEVEAQKTETPDIVATFRLLLFTGLRCGEIIDLTWGDVNLENATIRLRDSKTGARTVPLNDQATAVLNALMMKNSTGYVIRSSTGVGRPAIRKPWSRILIQANIDNSANIHCLRHTFASWAVMGGLSLAQTGALLGHKSPQTTLRYADHLTEAIRGYSQKTVNLIAAE
jgi:integrase